MRTRESEGERQGGAWRLRGVEEEAGGGQGEAGGGRGLSGARHASPLFVLLAEEEDDKGEEVGWAGWAGWWPPGGLQVSGPGRFLSSVFYFYFSSVFFYLICFATVLNLKIIQTMPKTPLKIFMLLNGLFQKHIKCFRVFGNIFYTSYEYNSKCK